MYVIEKNDVAGLKHLLTEHPDYLASCISEAKETQNHTTQSGAAGGDTVGGTVRLPSQSKGDSSMHLATLFQTCVDQNQPECLEVLFSGLPENKNSGTTLVESVEGGKRQNFQHSRKDLSLVLWSNGLEGRSPLINAAAWGRSPLINALTFD